MRISLQRHFAHPPQQFNEARLAREVTPHHQRVHEESDQPLRLTPHPVGNRRPDGQILLTRVTAQQHRERRQQGHEQGRSALAAEPL